MPQTETLQGPRGLPWLGDTLAIINDPIGYARRRSQRYGSAFKTTFMGQPAAVLLGEDAQQLVLMPGAAETPLFTTQQGYGFFTPILGKNILLVLDGPVHALQRRAIQPALAHHHDQAYLDQLTRVVAAQFAGWQTPHHHSGYRHFYQDSLEISFRMASALVLSREVGDQFRQLSHWWIQLLKGLPTPFRLNVPFTTYGRALAARKHLDTLLRQIVSAHRATAHDDILGRLISASPTLDYPLTDAELLDHVRFLLFAAYDTTSGILAWTLGELLQHPAALERVRAELHADAGAGPVTLADLKQTPYTDATIKEVVRLYPSGPILARGAQAAFTFAGKAIPAGTMILLIPPYTHRMPQYFANPDSFEPERFLPPRDEHKQHPFAYVGFGLGSHACLGVHLAPFEIKVVLAHLLRQFALELAPQQNLTQRFLPANRPASGMRIHYQSQ